MNFEEKSKNELRINPDLIIPIIPKKAKTKSWITAANRILGWNLPGYFPPMANSPHGAPSAIASWNSIAIKMKKQKMNRVSKGYSVIFSVDRPQFSLKVRFFENGTTEVS